MPTTTGSGLEAVVVRVGGAESDAVVEPTGGVVSLVGHDLQVQLVCSACRGPTGADVQDGGGDALAPVCGVGRHAEDAAVAGGGHDEPHAGHTVAVFDAEI